MKKRATKILSAFLALLMVVLVLPAGVITVSAETYSGTCGDNVTWNLDTSTGVLTISGMGAMANYGYGKAPWYSYSSSVKTVTIEEGVTSIGSCAFFACSSLTSAIFTNTEGWTAGNYSISSKNIADPATAATYLRSTYWAFAWTRSDSNSYHASHALYD